MSETIEKTFTVPSPARLKLNNIRGSVEIHPGEDGIISVTAVKHNNTGDASGTKVELSQDADGLVTVATRFPSAAWAWLTFSWPCRVDYVIKAPRQCSLKVKGVSSTILVEGFEGEFSIDSVSGEVTLQELTGAVRLNTVSGRAKLATLTGPLSLNTVSGAVSGEKLSGALKLDTVSGNADIEESNLLSVEAHTVSGRLRLQTPIATGPYHFDSVSGSVHLKVPGDTHCTAELYSVSGNLSVNLPQTSSSRRNGAQVVEVQGGGLPVHLKSISGGLSLEA